MHSSSWTDTGVSPVTRFTGSSHLISRTDVATHDVADLYSFQDNTGILERHRQLLSGPFQEGQVSKMAMLEFLSPSL